VRRRFLAFFDERELLSLGDAWERVRPGITD